MEASKKKEQAKIVARAPGIMSVRKDTGIKNTGKSENLLPWVLKSSFLEGVAASKMQERPRIDARGPEIKLLRRSSGIKNAGKAKN